MRSYQKLLTLTMLLTCFFVNAENTTLPPNATPIPILTKDTNTNKGSKPRMPSANPLPMCVYADGLLTISFPRPEGDAEVVITHTDYTEVYTASTETAILIYTDIAVDDAVEISTEEGNLYVAVRYE